MAFDLSENGYNYHNLMMSQKRNDPCQKRACELQVCLKKENFQESACKAYIDRLVECCRLWKEESFKVCSGIDWKEEDSSKPVSRSKII